MPYVDGLPAAATISLGDLVALDQGGVSNIPGTATTRKATLQQLFGGTTTPFLPLIGGTLTGPLIINSTATVNGATALNSTLNVTGTQTGSTINLTGAFNTTSALGYQQNGHTILNVFGSGVGDGTNTLVGYQAGINLPLDDSETTAMGYRALWSMTGKQKENTAIGWQSQAFETTATFNTSVGVNTLGANIVGSNNVAIGTDAMRNNTGANASIAVGSSAARNLNSGFNIAIGVQALIGREGDLLTTGGANVAIGYQSMSGATMTTAQNNVAIGANTFVSVTTGSQNIFVGTNAGNAATTVIQSVAIGFFAGSSLTGGFNNTFLGYQAGAGATGNSNTIIGSMDTTGTKNQITTGVQNIVIGTDVQVVSPTANGQIAIGNLIYGQNATGTGVTVSTGQLGIGVLPVIGATLNLGQNLAVLGTQVVAARDTGWTAMTGTPDKATAFATSTVTLAQLAGRVMSMQAALTTHGLLGT